MKKLSQILSEARRSKMPNTSDSGGSYGGGIAGNQNGENGKNDTVPTSSITDESEDPLATKGPDGHTSRYKTTRKIVDTVVKKFAKESAPPDTLSTGNMPGQPMDIDEGRPKKNATEDDPGSQHIIMQLRKVISTRGQHKVHHVNGDKSTVNPAHAHKMLAHHDNLKMPAEKHAYAARLHRSAASMKDAMAGKEEPKKAKISLAGKITGTQKEDVNEASAIAGVGSVRVTPVNMSGNNPHKRSSNAPKSAKASEAEAGARVLQKDKQAQQEQQHQKDQAEKQFQDRNKAAKQRQTIANAVKSKQNGSNSQ